jgi:hypothetical protein
VGEIPQHFDSLGRPVSRPVGRWADPLASGSPILLLSSVLLHVDFSSPIIIELQVLDLPILSDFAFLIKIILFSVQSANQSRFLCNPTLIELFPAEI